MNRIKYYKKIITKKKDSKKSFCFNIHHEMYA